MVITLLASRDIMCQMTLLQRLPMTKAKTLHTDLFTAATLKTLTGLDFCKLCVVKSVVHKMLRILEFYDASQTRIEFFFATERKKSVACFWNDSMTSSRLVSFSN